MLALRIERETTRGEAIVSFIFSPACLDASDRLLIRSHDYFVGPHANELHATLSSPLFHPFDYGQIRFHAAMLRLEERSR